VVYKKKAAEKKEKEPKKVAVRVDELLTFRHLSKKTTLEVDDVRHFTN
jgi:hypothetical protein